LGAVLDGSDRHALDAAPLRRGPDPPPADPAVDRRDPAAVARAYLTAARSATPADHGRTRRDAVPYAAAGSPAAVGVVVLDPPPPGQVRTAAVTGPTARVVFDCAAGEPAAPMARRKTPSANERIRMTS